MSALFLSPHNDDEILFGTFTLLRYQPRVVICLRSFRMADPTYPGDMPIDFYTREFETQKAMEVIGCPWEQWTFPDDDPDWRAVKNYLELLDDELTDPRYERIFAPAHQKNGHEQHNRLAEIADEVFGGRVTHYLTYTSDWGKSIGGTPVEYEPEWIAMKHAALACYQSQSAHPMTREHFMADMREFYA